MPLWIYGEELSQPVSPSAASVQGTGRGGRLSKSGQVFSDPRTPLKSVQRRNSQTENKDVTADVKITLSAQQQPCSHHKQPSATLSLHSFTHTHTHIHTQAHLGSINRALPPSPLSSKPLLSTDSNCPSPPSLFTPLILSPLPVVSRTARKIKDLLTQRCGPHFSKLGTTMWENCSGLRTSHSTELTKASVPPGSPASRTGSPPLLPTQGIALRFLTGR